MKFLTILTLVTMALGDEKMTKQWKTMKAYESCWGEENMKLHTVNIKRAIATCSNKDAPELFLPPYRSSYRFVNTIISGATKMENEQYEMVKKMMWMMKQQQSSRRPSSADYYKDTDNDWMEQMKMKFMMKQMMENMMAKSDSQMSYRQQEEDRFDGQDMMKVFSSMFANKMDNKMDTFRMKKPDSYRKNNPMAQLMEMFSSSRSKRAAAETSDSVGNPSLDLGDRLVEKLNEQKKQMEAKVGNMTCVLKEMNCLDSDNQLDVRAMKRDMEQYKMPSPWFAQRYEELLDTCYDMATNLPEKIEENAVVTGEDFGSVNMAEIKMFFKCCSKAKTKLCMNQDIKNKIEANFGPLEDILSQTQLTEYQIFPLVIQLLHGEEMEYMMGDY